MRRSSPHIVTVSRGHKELSLTGQFVGNIRIRPDGAIGESDDIVSLCIGQSTLQSKPVSRVSNTELNVVARRDVDGPRHFDVAGRDGRPEENLATLIARQGYAREVQRGFTHDIPTITAIKNVRI